MSTAYYRLTNGYNGPSWSLDVVGGTTDLNIAHTGNFSGQYWKLVPISGSSKFYLRTMYKGDEYSLDITNDANKTPHLAATGNYSGQMWTLKSVDDTFKLSNDFTGPSSFLDVYSDQMKPRMSSGDTSGMRWTFTLVKIQ
ncbi:carbohydrate-binding module family 13 protein [Russula earlei]|uniref:Carbohydrate-binding module family 13 protein n=2 Tax=Russula earlei TaxID=71964 RepID=A0ACC0U291_9AGAM|nr:carbohydrate-binding module family 13 protein [Russula earlei]KAI9456580.1 carbohydrate-binding module family 13 protein [Russula earlei]